MLSPSNEMHVVCDRLGSLSIICQTQRVGRLLLVAAVYTRYHLIVPQRCLCGNRSYYFKALSSGSGRLRKIICEDSDVGVAYFSSEVAEGGCRWC